MPLIFLPKLGATSCCAKRDIRAIAGFILKTAMSDQLKTLKGAK